MAGHRQVERSEHAGGYPGSGREILRFRAGTRADDRASFLLLTTARAIGSALGLPVIELDAINWQAGWRDLNTHDPTEFVSRVKNAVAAPAWVVDGNYERKIGDLVVSQADLVVWLDVPLRVVLWRLMRRTATRGHTGGRL